MRERVAHEKLLKLKYNFPALLRGQHVSILMIKILRILGEENKTGHSESTIGELLAHAWSWAVFPFLLGSWVLGSCYADHFSLSTPTTLLPMPKKGKSKTFRPYFCYS